eukprot:Nk52_evm20s207 gene=Nk52_evmTU20s207
MITETQDAAFSASASAVAAIFSTIAIERCGGSLGGIMASSPTVIVPVSIGIAANSPVLLDFITTLWLVPMALMVNLILLVVWRELPDLSPFVNITNVYAKLAALMIVSLVCWATGCLGLLILLSDLYRHHVHVRLIGLASIVCLFTLAVALCYRRPLPSPGAALRSNRPGMVSFIIRGLSAAIVAYFAVCLADDRPPVAAFAAAFPAVFLATVISLWLAHGEDVPVGAVGPMALGSVSQAVYAIFFCEMMVTLKGNADPRRWMKHSAWAFPNCEWCLYGVSASVAYLVAVLFISLPAYLLLGKLKKSGAYSGGVQSASSIRRQAGNNGGAYSALPMQDTMMFENQHDGDTCDYEDEVERNGMYHNGGEYDGYYED